MRNRVSFLLGCYCQALVDRINLSKSLKSFSKGCHQSVINEMKHIIDVHDQSLSEKYLGMPYDVAN